MKKVSGILLLLLFALLVSIPVTAEPYWVSNEVALDFALEETKLTMKEEVADDVSLVSEIMALLAKPPSYRLGIRPIEAVCSTTEAWLITLITPDAMFEVDFIAVVYNFGATSLTNNKEEVYQVIAWDVRS